MLGAQLKDIKKSMDFMFMLAMASSVHLHSHVLRTEDGHVFRMALGFEVEGQRKKGRPKKTWRKHAKEESVNIGLRREDALCRLKWSDVKWSKSDCCWVEVNLATLTCWGYLQILNIGVSLLQPLTMHNKLYSIVFCML